jgi:adenylate cyclase
MADANPNDELWRQLLSEGIPAVDRERFIYGLLPDSPRCSSCKVPFTGIGGALFRRFRHIQRSNYNPHFCNVCDEFLRSHPGGAEVDVALLFADVRGSTKLAESMSASDFSRLMDRFFTVATTAIVDTDGFIEKFVGDEVASIYSVGYAGHEYTRKAVLAARKVLEVTGHGDPNGPWLPVGVGIHWGRAYVGVVGQSGVNMITVLGDVANTTARLASSAKAGEVLVSDAAYAKAGLDFGDLERRALELKGKSEPFGVRVLSLAAQQRG